MMACRSSWPLRRLLIGLALGSIALCASALSRPTHAQVPAPAAAQRYRLQVELDPERRRLAGTVQISFRNHSRAALSELLFHLYPNAFANERTVFMREGGASIRGGRLQRRGGIRVSSLRLADGTDLLPRADNELVPNDRTQLRVALPAPLAPGATLALDARFEVELPSLLARMGSAGDFFLVAQFFPKLAKLEADGRFASFPYHGLGEFYADFADYDLAIDVPERFVVAAPGQLVERRALPGGRRLERYQQRRALDIAFAAAPDLRHVHAAGPGGVRIDGYAPAGHIRLARAQAALIADGLAELSRRLGPYPYPRLVFVLPPPAALGAAGMEYPGFITGWTAGAATQLNPAARVLHDVVTSHELAHQWFPILVATNEVESPVLDEGLAEWVGLELVRARLGGRRPLARALGLPLDVFDLLRLGFARAPAAPSSLLPAYRYRPEQLGPAVYLRPALALETIARTWGRERVWSALGSYARAHRFGHPRMTDLERAFDGAFYPGFAGRVLRPALEGRSFATRLEAVAGAQPPALRLRREKPAALPEVLALSYADRGTERIAWPAGSREQSVRTAPGREALGASLDPDAHNLLDPRRSDDQRRLSPLAPEPPLLARLLLIAQAALGVLGP